jgi:L-threonylcarbamoyladenylate synthase
MKSEWKKVEDVVKGGGIAVLPTDTLYGIVAKADDKKAVERIYGVKGRDDDKPFIILITSVKDLEQFGIKKSVYDKYVDIFQPKTSIILPVTNNKFKYLHRGKGSLAFRVISKRNGHLYDLIRKAGPLVAPSANPQGKEPARNRREARAYFGNKIDAYICYGTRSGKPSTIISLVSGKPVLIRK